MKRWIWTFLIIFALGMTVACGSKKGGSGATPAPTDPTDPGVVPPTCTEANGCVVPPEQLTYKSFKGGLYFNDQNALSRHMVFVKKHLKARGICDQYTPIQLWDWTIGGNWGTSDCNNYNNANIRLTILGNMATAEMEVLYNGWPAITLQLGSAPISLIENNTGYQTEIGTYNDVFRFRMENQNLQGHSVRIKLSARIYNMSNPSNSTFADIGVVDASTYNSSYYY